MKKYVHALFALGMLLFAHACFYSDSELYVVDPVADDPPVISVSSNLDTLINPPVNDSLKVSYEVSIQDGELYLVEAELAQQSVYSSYSIQDSFWIQPYYVQDSGVDTLYLSLYYSSNTNTLGDASGLEALVLDSAYAIYFNLEELK